MALRVHPAGGTGELEHRRLCVPLRPVAHDVGDNPAVVVPVCLLSRAGSPHRPRWTLHLPARWPWQHLFTPRNFVRGYVQKGGRHPRATAPTPRPCDRPGTRTRSGGCVAMQHARDRIRGLTARSRLLLDVEHIVRDLNRLLRGWAGCFRWGNSARTFTNKS